MKVAEVSAGAQDACPQAWTTVEHTNASILGNRHNVLHAACTASLKICEHDIQEMGSFRQLCKWPQAAELYGKQSHPYHLPVSLLNSCKVYFPPGLIRDHRL